jgi:membrane-bound serine protease (ClpP class)
MIGSKYLVGMANWVEVALIIVGFVLLLIEIFVIPGFGVAGISGIVCILAGLFGTLVRNRPDELPWPKTQFDWDLLADGVVGISIGLFGFIVVAMLISKYLPQIPLLGGLILSPSVLKPGTGTAVSMTGIVENRGTAVNVGDLGEVVNKLRPAGKARFDDVIVDVVADGEFLDTGRMVRIIRIHGNRVIVKKADS